MSQKTQSTREEDLAQYRTTTGSEMKTADIASDDHPLKQKFGDDKERKYDAKHAGERFVQFYDDSAAAIREYLSNAETACIRRARRELESEVSVGTPPEGITELLELAEEKTGYEPLIEVTYNQKSDEPRLIIEDNGIGISSDEYEVVRSVGYSTSHGDGTRLGQFGMGWMSGFQLTSIHGVFRMYTRSYLTDEAYSTIEYVRNFDYLDATPQEYGTRFEFPEFGEAAKEIDIASKVAEFAEGMRVAVLYREFDESGSETSNSDDYLPRSIESDYDDDSLVVTFENEFFKAAMSPDSATGRRNGDYITYNVTMPIRRNTDSWGSNPKFEAPWKWDFRGKREDAPVVSCESDPSIVGLVPVENTKYDNISLDMRDNYMPMSKVPDDAIVMPGPASSRDSYMSGHDDFWKYVSECLNEAWADVAKERFAQLQSWDDFLDMSREEKRGLFRAYNQFGPGYGKNEPNNVQETLEEAFSVTVPIEVCERIDQCQNSVAVVPRNHSNPHHKKPAQNNKKNLWEVIDEAPDGVYVGKSISVKKAEIAWGLGDTHVVRIDPKGSLKRKYEEMEELWGFTKLKDLPNSNLKEKLPQLDDDVAEKWENKKSPDKVSSSSGSRRTSRDPTSKRITVRVGKRSPRYISEHRVSTIESRFEKDMSIRAGRYNAEYLIIYDQTNTSSSTAPTGNAEYFGEYVIAVTAVPNYVYKYMKDIPHVFTSKGQLDKHIKQEEIERCKSDEELVLYIGGNVYDEYSDCPEELVELLNDIEDADIDTSKSIEVRRSGDRSFSKVERDDIDAEVVCVNTSKNIHLSEHNKFSLDMIDIEFDRRVPEMDTDAPEFRQVFGNRRYLTYGSKKMERGIEMVQAMGGKFPSQQ